MGIVDSRIQSGWSIAPPVITWPSPPSTGQPAACTTPRPMADTITATSSTGRTDSDDHQRSIVERW